jgi:iron complex outermembrane receptor protein
MTNKVAGRFLRAGFFVLAGFTVVVAQAAETAAQAPLEEVIVTAQNRAQDVLDVPIAIDVLSAKDLQKAGFSDLNSIDKIAPVVQLNQDQGTVKVTVRGVGTTSGDEAQDTSVVINIDGEYINRPNVLGVSMFDMERVEVLRGPQGTLYGRNSTGGAINFITRKPGKDFSVNGSASYGNYNAKRLDGGVSVPLGDSTSLRFAAFYEDRDGYVKHPAGGGFFVFPAFGAGRSDDNQASGGRVSFRLAPSGGLSVDLAAEYAKRKFTPGIFAAADLNAPGNAPTGPGCNAPGYTLVAPAYQTAPSPPAGPYGQTLCIPSSTNFLSTIDRSSYAAPLFGLGHIGEDTYALRARVAYKFSDAATLTYIGGYRSFSGDSNNYLTLPVIYQSFAFKDDAKTQSHELRLNGEVGRVIYQVGGFYFKEDLDRENGFFVRLLNPVDDNGNPIPGFDQNGSFLSYFGRNLSSNSKSLFGQVDVSLTDKLTAVGGLRYTENKRDALYINGSPFVTFGPTGTGAPIGGLNHALFGSGSDRKDILAADNPTGSAFLNLGNSESKTTWLLGLNYKPNRDTLLYGKVSTGFKGGGFDSIGIYKPENNTAFEAGMKQRFGDHGQNEINLGSFYYDYKDLQVSVLLDTSKGGQTFNAGKATIWGLEASGDFELTQDDRVHFSANYLNAEYKELFAQFNVFTVHQPGIPDLNGVGDLDPTTVAIEQPNFAGHRPPFSPEFIIALGYDHTFNLGSAGSLTARLNSTYKSEYYTDFYNYNDGRQKAYTQSDVGLDYQPTSKKLTVSAFVRNLENKRPLTYGSFISAGPDDVFNWQFGTPRTFGLRISADY